MKKQMKLFTFLTKPLVLFALLFAFGVGEMWAGTKTVYVETTQCSTYDNVYIHYWDDGSGDQVATQITDYFWMASIPENAKWCVFRKVDGSGYNYLENVTNSDNFFYVVSFDQSKGNSHATTHLKTYDGTEYIYWRTNPADYNAWGDDNATLQIRLIRLDGDNLGFVNATDKDATTDHIARYLVPAGTYIRPELHTTKNNAYSKTFEFSATATDNFIYNFTNDGGRANWATTFFARSAYVYFDNTNSQWTDAYKEILVGRDGTSDTYNMTLVPNTNNLYCYTSGLTYNDFTQFCFVGNSSHWGQYNDNPNNRKGSANTNTANYQVNMDHSSRLYNLFIPAGTTKGTSLTHTAYGDYTSLNYTQTVEQKLSENGGDSYSTSTRALATVSVNSYKMTSATGTTADGGSITSGQSSKSCDAARTATVTYLVSSVAEGYTFVGWYDGDTEKSTSTTYTYEATEAKTITARFKANAYTVVFNGNDKTSGSMSNQTFYYNVAQNLTTNAYGKNGYNFGGWTTNNDGTGSSYTNGQSVSNWSSTDGASITIYAKWTQNVTLDLESGTSGSTSVTATYNSATLGSYDNPERSGYTFGGYYSGDDGTGELIINTSKALQANKTDNADVYTGAGGIWKHAGATTLHAQWTAKDYTINLANMEATTPGTTSVDVTFDASTNMTASNPIIKPTKTHYDFAGYWTSENTGVTLDHQLIAADGKWIKEVEGYTSHDGSGNPTWVHDYAISLYAKWTEHEYAVTLAISPAGAGTTSPASSTTAKYVTASADITATPSTGYSFREWGFSKTDEKYDVYVSDDKTYSSTDATIKINAQHNGTLTANFTPNTYTVRFENLGADAGHKGSLDTTVTFNDTIHMKGRIEVPSKTYYDFGGYYISTNKGATLTTQIIDANGNWNKGVSGYTGEKEGVASWVCAADTVLYAKWTEKSHTVAVNVSSGGYSGNPGKVQINSVDVNEVTVGEVTWSAIMTPIANPGWKFAGWEKSSFVDFDLEHYHSDYQESRNNSMVIKAYAEDQTITAVFEPRYYLVGGELVGNNDDITTSGMPGWGNYDAPFIVTTSSPLLATCTRTLTNADKTYKILVRDKNDGISYGVNTDPFEVIEDGESLLFDDANYKVYLYAKGGTTFTFKITDLDASGHPYVSLDRPHQLHFGTGYAGIDNLSSVTSGTTGGTLAVTANESTLSNEDWVNYGTDVTYSPSAATGYTFGGFYSSNEYSYCFTQDNPWVHHNVTGDDNVYAKFEEKSTSVTLANDGNGHVTIGGNTETSTTCGVTTTRELTAVPNEGYIFSSWNKSGDDIEITSTSTNPTTLTGNGAGETDGQEVRANFTYRYSIKGTMNGEDWKIDHLIANIGTNAGSKDTGYVEITLPANTTYEFAIYDKKTGVANPWLKNGTNEVFIMTYTNHTNWSFGTDKTSNCGITTAGKGTYKFIFNITDKTMTVTYPTSYQVNYGASVGGSVTSVKDDDNNDVPNGGYVRSGGNVTYTATPNDGYTFVGWCNDDSYGEPFTTYNPWPNNSVTATSNAYAKFKSTNFVIYRSGDMAEDDRAALDDVESYGGGTISEIIEYRMKVHTLDQWTSLYLPFEVNAVKVWDEADGAYYDIVPFYRIDGKFYTGHYIIRKPETVTNYAIATFEENWQDPTSPDGYLPNANTPYIIQWHDDYFLNKYISFFGEAEQTIPTEFTAGAAPSVDDVVNVHGNNTMHNGAVIDAYLLEPDYGPFGAWLREDIGTDRTIKPFECYILAKAETTARYRVLRRGMKIDDTPTGWDDVANSENQTTITVYTIAGFRIAQYTDCSFAEAAKRLNTEHSEGIYILRSENESVKLMIGGK